MFSQVTPKAIAHMHWKYFAVFMACDACAALTFYFFYPYVCFLDFVLKGSKNTGLP